MTTLIKKPVRMQSNNDNKEQRRHDKKNKSIKAYHIESTSMLKQYTPMGNDSIAAFVQIIEIQSTSQTDATIKATIKYSVPFFTLEKNSNVYFAPTSTLNKEEVNIFTWFVIHINTLINQMDSVIERLKVSPQNNHETNDLLIESELHQFNKNLLTQLSSDLNDFLHSI